MYKYIGNSEKNINFLNNRNNYNSIINSKTGRKDEIKENKYLQDCNTPQASATIQFGNEEGGSLDGWTLQGVLLLIRHGDRGPMSHVRDINTVNCGHDNDNLLNKYRNYLLNSSSVTTGPGHSLWMKIHSPFHNFPLLPPSSKSCLLGQLTYKGLAQLLHVGEILRQAYAQQLELYHKPVPPIASPPQSNSTASNAAAINTDDIVIFATRYRRTFQSAMALMYSLLPTERWNQLQIQESHSLSFCFADCACPQAENLKKMLGKESTKILQEHAATAAVVSAVGSALLQNSNTNGQTYQYQPLEVRDAVLALLCHNAPLPCRHIDNFDNSNNDENDISIHGLTTSDSDNNDVINIDQDDNTNIQHIQQPQSPPRNLHINTDDTDDPDDQEQEPTEQQDGCIDQSQITTLMAYTHWYGLKEANSKNMKKQGLLRSYGLIRNIVNYMLKMISGDKTKFVLYSGHDKTMQFLLAALNINLETSFIPYAARLSFEVYKSLTAQYYFRLIYNGHDITRQISFCEGGRSLRISRGIRGNRADLCPIENIIRFIHDDYFTPLNATNFKDACTTTIQKDFNYF